MEKIIRIYKKEGETPLELINRIKTDKPEYKDIKMTYAGRLDPLADGEMIILAGDEVHNKNEYTKLPKEYETDIVLGISTDTFDALGLVLEEGIIKNGFKEKIKKYIEKNIGTIIQKYPMYSSKTVDGVQLHNIARNGAEIDIPEHNVIMHSCDLLNIRTISKENLHIEIFRKIDLVNGDFRQEMIKERWNDYFSQSNILEYPIIKIKMKVGSGFYVRSFANDLGDYLKSKAFALKITRTKIG